MGEMGEEIKGRKDELKVKGPGGVKERTVCQ